MCRRVRDADRLESLKPQYSENDISTEVDVAEGIVDLKCTRFNTRIRLPSGHQVRPIVHAPPVSHLIDLSADPVDYSISVSKPTKADSKDM